MTIGYLEDRIAKLEMEIQNLQEEHEALVEGVRYLRNEIAKTQAVDAEPIRHGKWEYVDAPVFGNPYGSYKCDYCGNSMPHKTNYCPNCGAKMDGSTMCQVKPSDGERRKDGTD